MLPKLTVDALCAEARIFADVESTYAEPALYGVTDGKAIGTYFEHKVRAYVATKYDFTSGSSGKGIDFPSIGVDVEVTSIKQPQSSCPFKSVRENIRPRLFAIDFRLRQDRRPENCVRNPESVAYGVCRRGVHG